MKYIVTERQYDILNEIGRESGHLEFDALSEFYEFLERHLPNKVKYKAFRDFFFKKMGRDVETRSNFKHAVDSYFSNGERSPWSPDLLTKDARSGLAYYIAKKYLGLKEDNGMSYYVYKEDKENPMYYFFDPQFKIFVGKIFLMKKDGFPRNSFKVALSASDEELIGMGYGLKMYLIVIKNVDYLISDTVLYSGSYRLWKHILPKYVNVWGVSEKGDSLFTKRNFVEILPNKKISVTKFKYFVASTKHNELSEYPNL